MKFTNQIEICFGERRYVLMEQELEKDKNKDKTINFNKNKTFVRLYCGILELKKKLTDREFAVAIALSDFVCDDCCLREGGRGNGKILTMQDLSEKLDVTYDNLKGIILSLRKKNILAIFIDKDKRKIISVNPYVYSRDSRVSDVSATYFKDFRDRED
jgi:hypothetical protein